MKKLKHNKVKNTGILFEILCRNLTHETLNPSLPQTAIKIIRKHFGKESLLLKELQLYHTLTVKSSDGIDVVSLTKDSRGQIANDKLSVEKFNLIREIKSKYKLEEFFGSRVGNYRLLASIYKLFEHNGTENPTDYLENRNIILQYLSDKPTNVVDSEFELLQEVDRDEQQIAFKIIVEKFNSKYRTLSDRQKRLLTKYINEDVEKSDFKDYVVKEISWIGKKLQQSIDEIDDKVLKIKLNEVIDLSQGISSAKQITDDQLSAMLKYYQLIEELK